MDQNQTEFKVLDCYDLKGPVKIEKVNVGRVNRTFRVTAGNRMYSLQRLHPVFGSDGTVVRNSALVGRILNEEGVAAPEVVPTRKDRLWVESDGLWRLSTWAPGLPTEGQNEKNLSEAAMMLGRFHRAVSGLGEKLAPLPEAEHNREDQVSTLEWGAALDRARRNNASAAVIETMGVGREITLATPPVPLLTEGVVHGDPKLDNFLFREDGSASAVIDLDTVRFGAIIWDIADALRSWAINRKPGAGSLLDRERFAAAVRAYRQTGLELAEEEWRNVAAAVRAKSLRLALRYLNDAHEQSYFVWDQAKFPSLEVQNLTRGSEMLAYAREWEN